MDENCDDFRCSTKDGKHIKKEIIRSLTKEQKKFLKNAFDAIDVNNDNSLDTYELGALLKRLGEDPTEELVNKISSIADIDADGKIDFDEFCNAVLENLMLGQLVKLNFSIPSM